MRAATVWPVEDSHEIQQGYQEGLGEDAPDSGFHEGTDIRRTVSRRVGGVRVGNKVYAARGGVITHAGAPNPYGAGYYLRVEVGGGAQEFDSWNHLAIPLPLTVADVVMPGQLVGYIGMPPEVATWNRWVDHTHFFTADATGGRAIRHPLLMFSQNADRDPQEKEPRIYDEIETKRRVIVRDSAGTDIQYDHDKTPISDSVDLEVPLNDDMGISPQSPPTRIGYWIEGPLPAPTGGVDGDNVKTKDKPYVLVDYESVFYGLHENPALPTARWRVVHDDQLDQRGLIGPRRRRYPWHNFHYYVLTNCTREDGAAAGLDSAQTWNTTARWTSDGPDVAHANFHGRAVARGPYEARFPDGDYTLHVPLRDLVHRDVVDKVENLRLENFAPFIREIQVWQDSDDDSKTPPAGENKGFERLVYSFVHSYPEEYPGDKLLEKSQKGIAGRGKILIKVRFSEPMDDDYDDFRVALDPQGTGHGATEVEFDEHSGGWSKTYANNDTWFGTLTIPADKSGTWDSLENDHTWDAEIVVEARDRGVSRGGAMQYLRLTGDSDNTPDGADRNHKLMIDTKNNEKPVPKIRSRSQ